MGIKQERRLSGAGGRSTGCGGMCLRGHPGTRASRLVDMAKETVRAPAGSSPSRWWSKPWERGDHSGGAGRREIGKKPAVPTAPGRTVRVGSRLAAVSGRRVLSGSGLESSREGSEGEVVGFGDKKGEEWR